MQINIKKYILPNLPYVMIGLYASKLGQMWRLAPGADFSAKVLGLMDGFAAAFQSAAPSFHPADLLVGLLCGAALRLAVYVKGKNAKKYRHNMEYGSARWGNAQDIAPYIAPKFEDNIILTQTERLTMNSRPKDPKTARNKNVLIIGGSGSGKTRFFLKPNLMQCTSKTYPVWIIDEEAAAVVRRIFQSVLAGETVASIAKALRAEKIPIPSEHWKRTGEPVRAAKYTDPYAWSATTIGYILKRPEYTGRKVLGKTVCENYKTKSSRKTTPEEQYIFEGAIPAIVDVETWQTVQKIRETVRRAPKRQNAPNRLTGLLYCADCGSKLTHRYNLVQGKWVEDAFICSGYRHLDGVVNKEGAK